jgi:rifampicin phosphotransferase
MKAVLFFSEIPETDTSVSLVGGKAYNLARMAKAGFHIPEGFCITTYALDRTLEANGWQPKGKPFFTDQVGFSEEAATSLREAVLSAPISADVQAAVMAAYRRLCGDDEDLPVAVRSSGLGEDGSQASYAGQFETVLNVCGETALFESIKRCWSSLWSSAGLVYRSRVGQTTNSVQLAVIVQRMLAPRCAGVAFTVDPMSGKQEILIEAVDGPADRLVSGEVDPFQYRLETQNCEILEVHSPHKGDLPLSVEEARQVARTAIALAHYFGGPQDVEWVYEGDKLYILQSRPVTAAHRADYIDENRQLSMDALLSRAEAAGREIWTDDNVGEVFPGAVTPLTWSVLEPVGNRAFGSFLRRIGVRGYPSQGLFGRFYGKVYFNQSQFQRLMNRFFPSRIPDGKKVKINKSNRLKAYLRLVETGVRSGLLLPATPVWGRRIVEDGERYLQASPPIDSIQPEKLLEEIGRCQEYELRGMDAHLITTIYLALLYALLDKLVKMWSGQEIETAQLLAGLPGMRSAEMGRDLAALSGLVASTPELKDCLLRADQQDLMGCVLRLPERHPFLRAFSEFLERHGHSSAQEFELSFPRWSDDPAHILILIQSRLGERQSQERTESDLQKKRIEAVGRMRRRLSFGLRRLIFEAVLWLTQIYSVDRENHKYVFIKVHSRLRGLYLALGAALVADGKLMKAGDIFFLHHEELKAFVSGSLTPKTTALQVADRRKDHERDQANILTAPSIIELDRDGNFYPVDLEQPAAPEDTQERGHYRLRGAPASSGRAIGQARVITDMKDAASLKPGEILITRATNPAWSPLLLTAAGLVTEIGGLLSHGAIVAREYGLPAVLNVKGVTGSIRSGQRVLVDGTQGIVEIFEDQI